ncbi:uncharacterized protein [Miscanthus floridulus]|uniref:uncharacterized protein n=1 Tax=Miscanthus floridulus TaxID=154761 RepID=UPI0034595236
MTVVPSWVTAIWSPRRYFLDKLRTWSQQEAAAVWASFSSVRHTENRVADLSTANSGSEVLWNNYFNDMFLSLLIFFNHATELLTNNKLSELACLTLYLMYEKKQGKDSFWYPYIKELDQHRGRGQLAVESPFLWTESELDYLTGSPLKDEVVARDEAIRREYNELDTLWFMAGSLFQQYPFEYVSA